MPSEVPMWRPLRLASKFLRTRERECMVTALRMIRPSLINFLRSFGNKSKGKRGNPQPWKRAKVGESPILLKIDLPIHPLPFIRSPHEAPLIYIETSRIQSKIKRHGILLNSPTTHANHCLRLMLKREFAMDSSLVSLGSILSIWIRRDEEASYLASILAHDPCFNLKITRNHTYKSGNCSLNLNICSNHLRTVENKSSWTIHLRYIKSACKFIFGLLATKHIHHQKPKQTALLSTSGAPDHTRFLPWNRPSQKEVQQIKLFQENLYLQTKRHEKFYFATPFLSIQTISSPDSW